MNDLILFGIVVIIHEIGHYILFRIFNINPKISIKWYGIGIGETKDYFKLNSLSIYLITIGGILSGLIPIAPLNGSITLYYVYIIACFFDIIQIITIFRVTVRKWQRYNYGELLIMKLEKDLIELKNIQKVTQ